MRSDRSRALEITVALLLNQGEPWVTFGEQALSDLIVELSPTTQGRAPLLRYVRTTTRVAVDADPAMPRQMQRLLRLMRDRHFDVTLPICQNCGHERLLTQSMPDGRRVCDSCRSARHARRCDDCGQLRPIARTLDGTAFCSMCWRRRPEARRVCVACGTLRLTHTVTPAGPLCPVCAPGKVEPCVHCGKLRRVRVRFTGGATCEPCLYIIRNTRRPCPRCGTVTLVASVTDDATLACSACAGTVSHYVCVDCGVEDIKHGRRCYRCAAADNISVLFAAGTPAMRRVLEPVRQRLLAHPEPKSMVQWPTRSATAAILAQILREELPMTYNALDEHPMRHAAGLLRALLVDTGCLPARDDGWAVFERWLQEFIADLPRQHAAVLTPFCRWEVPAKTRLSIRRRGQTDGTFDRARRQCRAALAFLVDLDRHGVDLSSAPQSAWEDYLDRHPREAQPLQNFIRWAATTGKARRIRPIPARNTAPFTAYPLDTYRDWVHRFATDESLPLRARICGLLAGLLGRPSTVIAKISRDQITDDGETVTILFGRTPVQLPPPLPDLIRRQLAAPRRWDVTSTWLFPSKLRAGAHVDYSRLVLDMRDLGCAIVALRGAAMLNLASTMPVGPLADMTGAAVHVLDRWALVASSAYSRYPHLRQLDSHRALPLKTGEEN